MPEDRSPVSFAIFPKICPGKPARWRNRCKEDDVVHPGDDVDLGPEPRQGLRVEHVDSTFRVANGANLTGLNPPQATPLQRQG